MANELLAQSQSRNGATVLWITIHTAEGPTDEFPSQPDLDAGSARDLLAFGLRAGDRSWHACCDDDVILDNLVPYDRAAWTLRNGNNYSDNLEMCGLASWSRDEWLEHKPMIARAARWVAARCKARGITPRRLSVAEVAARSSRGYIDHGTYTLATGDGTHTDVGPHFPWDVFGPMVTAAFSGANTLEDDVPLTTDEIDKIADAVWAKGLKGELSAPEPAGALLVRARLGWAIVRDLLPGVSTRAVMAQGSLAELLGRPTADVDEAALAAALAPLLTPSTVAELAPDTLAAIAKTVTDEQARRLAPAPATA